MDLNLMTEGSSIEEGNMVDLPHDVLEKLNEKKIDPPYFFQISTQSSLKSYVGVRQFTSQKDTIEIPYWLSDQLGIFGNQIVNLKLIKNIPKGKFIKIRPETEDFFDIPEYESCLETKLSLFPLLYQGMTIVINIMDKNYSIKIEDIDMDWENFDFDSKKNILDLNVIDVINSDINVEIKNTFLEERLRKEMEEKKRLEEERRKIEEQKRLELERLKKEEQLKKDKESNKSFIGEGRKLSENSESMKNRSVEDIRAARMKWFNKQKKEQKENSLDDKNSSNDFIV